MSNYEEINNNERDEEREWEESKEDFLEELEDLGWDWDAYDPE